MEKQIDKESISKRDIILNESFRLFLKKGYAAVSFSDLVEATGISRGNMFHHFKNKEDIFNHAVDRFVFEFLTNDATDFLELTSSTPLKDFIDNRVENIGRRMKSFFKITTPMMMNGIISGALLSWITIITELSSSIILYNYKTITLTLQIYVYVSRGSYGIAAAMSAILTLMTVVSLLIFMRVSKNKNVMM